MTFAYKMYPQKETFLELAKLVRFVWAMLFYFAYCLKFFLPIWAVTDIMVELEVVKVEVVGRTFEVHRICQSFKKEWQLMSLEPDTCVALFFLAARD